jgi:zinc protease
MLTALLLAQMAAAPPPPARFELPNGLRVWVQEDHGRPVALVQITYHAGSLNESAGLTGVAHYVEHMVYRATENVRNEDVYGYIDRIGGRYTGGTWPDVTRYAETVPSWALESALRVTAERMTRALFDSLEFERERSNVVTEAHGFADSDDANRLRDAVMMAAFELHPYRYGSNTWARDNLTLTRRAAYAWYREHYGPNNAVLVIVGDVKAKDARRLVEKHFGPLPRAPGNGRIDLVEPPQEAEKRIWLSATGDSSRLEIVYRAPAASHPDFPALVRFDDVFSTRLRAVLATAHPGARVETHDTATAYPYVYRISVIGGRSVNMTDVLSTVDRVIAEFHAQAASIMVPPAPLPRSADSSASHAPSAAPPRGSRLTNIADALADRELPAWEVSGSLRDSISVRAGRVTPASYTAFARTWLVPTRRTVGILQGGNASVTAPRSLDVPAMTTPPARRMRPEPVPARALQPLSPLAIEHATRALPNGVRVHAARGAGPNLLLRVIIDYGYALDTLVRPLPVASADAAMAGALAEIRIRLARRPAANPDSSVEERARGRAAVAVISSYVFPMDSAAPLSVALVGPMPAGELLALASRHLGGLPARNRTRFTGELATNVPATEMVKVAGQRQVEIAASLPGVPRDHRDRRALELLTYIVGVPYYGGRLGWALTKTGLTYSSSAQTWFGDAGYILLGTTADTRNTPAVIQAIREIVAGIGEQGVEEWELNEAKAFTLGRTLLYGAREDSPASVIAAALTDSDAAGLDRLDLPALSRAYLSVTLDDVNRVARAYYRPDRLKVVAMGAVPSDDMTSPFAPGTFRALFEPR